MGKTGMLEAIDCGAMSELIPPYVEGTLAPGLRGMVAEHLAECGECFKEAQAFRSMRQIARDGPGDRSIGKDFRSTKEPRLKALEAERAEASEGELDGEGVPEAPSFMDSLQRRFGAAPWWMISGAFHTLLILLVTLIGLTMLRDGAPETIIVTDLAQRKESEEIEKPRERDILTKPEVPVVEELDTEQTPIVTHEELEVSDHAETDDASDFSETRGEDGVSDVWLGGSGSVASLGLGGGGGGAFGRPGGRGGRLRRAIRGGGGKATESAVARALEWLARHQHADGSWHTKELEGTCSWDPGVTGLALLAFLGAGHTEKIGKYKGNVQNAIKWIVSQQRANGAIGADPRFKDVGGGYGYHHVICGMGLAEAFGMARVPATGDAAQKALDYACDIHQQGKGSEKLGFRYLPQMSGDISCTAWFVMQLKSGKMAGLKIDPASIEGAMKFVNSCEARPAAEKKSAEASHDSGAYRFCYKSDADARETHRKVSANTTAMGILAHLFTGTKPEEMAGAAEWLLRTQPPAWRADLGPGTWGSYPMYYTYYGTLDMFQIGGDLWKNWNTALKAMLLPNQRKDGDFDGSWDPLAKWEKCAGRAYSTALGALSLEVYYRYLPMYR